MYTELQKRKNTPYAIKANQTRRHALFMSARDNKPIQKYQYDYGNLYQDSGTSIKTDLIKSNDVDGGTPVSVWPTWWPTGPAETSSDFLRTNFVQGHLLNEKLGGPGNERYNLTPLTRSANSQMSVSIENTAKQFLSNGYAITYEVKAHYDQHPTVQGVGAGHLSQTEAIKLQTELNKMAYWVSANITVYQQTNGSWTPLPANQQPDVLWVANEGTHLKGTYS